MKNYERIIWISAVLLALAFVFWDRQDRHPTEQSVPPEPANTAIEARCGVAAGGALSSKEIAITCGLDEQGVEAVIAQAIGEFNLGELVTQVKQEETDLPAALDQMALRLGITREAIIDLLRTQDTGKSTKDITPALLAKAIVEGEPQLAVNVTSTIARAPSLDPSGKDSLASAPGTPRTLPQQSAIPHTAPEVPKHVVEEVRKLQVECGVVAGKDAKVGVTRITCGPEKEDIDAIIKRLVAAAEIEQLVADLRQGRLTQNTLADAFQKELNLSRSTVLSLLNRTASYASDQDEMANQLKTLTKEHVQLTYELGLLPADNPDSKQLRNLAATALANGDYTTAQTLLHQWSEIQESRKALSAAEKELSSVKQQLDNLIAKQDIGPDKSAEEQQKDEATRLAKNTTPPEDSGQDTKDEMETQHLYVTQDRTLLKSPSEVVAGTMMTFEWQGPAAPNDLIFHAKNDLAENRYPTSNKHRHTAAKGSPAILIAPAEPGDYEIRYFSYANGKPLVRVPLKVNQPEVSFSTPKSIKAGSVMEFEWSGPNAPDDMLFITKPTTNKAQYFTSNRKRHMTSAGSSATLVAPAKTGTYEIRYYSYNNGSVLFSQALEVTEPEVRIAAPQEVSPGAHMQFTWQGPAAPGDMLFIAKPDAPENRYYASGAKRHLTRDGRIAELVAPADPGEYEIRYFSYANGSVLSAVPIVVQ